MSEIAEYERRIRTAFDDIELGIGRLASSETHTELEDLRIELEAEQKASSLLEERVTALRRGHEARIAELELELSEFPPESGGAEG